MGLIFAGGFTFAALKQFAEFPHPCALAAFLLLVAFYTPQDNKSTVPVTATFPEGAD